MHLFLFSLLLFGGINTAECFFKKTDDRIRISLLKLQSSKISKVIAMTIVPSIFLFSNPMLATLASDGSPNLQYFQKNEDLSLGPVLYIEGEKSIILNKYKLVASQWGKMTEMVFKLVTEGRKKDAQSTISNMMVSFKSDLRSISKAASAGEILVRNEQGAAANFDYNSGTFELKPIAQKAEDIINQLNDLYFYSVLSSKDEAISELQKADSLFLEWKGVVGKQLNI